jgi:hypothetical protein
MGVEPKSARPGQYDASFTSVKMLCTMSRDFLPAPVAR